MLIPIAFCSFTVISFSPSETVCVSLGVDASFIDLFNIPGSFLFIECSTGTDADGLIKTDGFCCVSAKMVADSGKGVGACAVFCSKYDVVVVLCIMSDDLESDFK